MDAMTPFILTVGSLAFDSLESPAGKVENVLGGSANYFSIAASLFFPVSIVAVIGEDFPQSHLDWLKSRRVDVSGVEIAKGKSFHWKGRYGNDLNDAETLSTSLNVFEHFQPRLQEHHRAAPYVFLGNIDPVLQLSVLEQTPKTELVVCDTMNLWIQSKTQDLKAVLKKTDILSINQKESYLLTGTQNLHRAATMILKMGPSVVVVKQGEFGSAVYSSQGVFLAPAYPVESVVDPTGAGDTFAGGFVSHLAQSGVKRTLEKTNPKQWDQRVREATLHGSVLASFTVEEFSHRRLARLTLPEFEARKNELLSMMKI